MGLSSASLAVFTAADEMGTIRVPARAVSVIVVLLTAALRVPALAQYIPPTTASCARGFTYSAGVCVPRSGDENVYQLARPGSCGPGFIYSAGLCIPRTGGATNAYLPPRPGLVPPATPTQRLCVNRGLDPRSDFRQPPTRVNHAS
jgi:hypothetical protein